jgi:large subunit ribosomal protein L35
MKSLQDGGTPAQQSSVEIGIFHPIPLKKEKTMPKLKTHTGAAKRFSKTGSGKIKRHQTKMRHILTSKLPKTKRKLGKSLIVSDADHDKVARMIPYA